MSNTKPSQPGHEEEGLRTLLSEQRRHLMEAQTLESDLDLAFNLQLQEALSASLSLHPSSSSSSSSSPQQTQLPVSHSISSNIATLQTLELDNLQQQLDDRLLMETEFKKLKADFSQRIHDKQLALDIQAMDNEDWEDQGDNFERPFGEGSSKGVESEIFRLYFKGLMSEEAVFVAGIGIAVCDSRDQLVFEVRKPLIGKEMNRRVLEFEALIEALSAAVALDLKRLVYCCDYYPIYNFVTGRWQPKQQKIAALVNQVLLLQSKFTYCRPTFVARNDIKFAFKFAREAIVSQISKSAESSGPKNEQCVICLEDTDAAHFFSIDVCMHRYCFSCMRQHVEVKLHQGILPKCPHEGCNSELKTDSCAKFLTSKLVEIMNQRVKEASIPQTQKIYCPFPKCSALMSKKAVLEYSKPELVGAEKSGVRKCMKCQQYFCINCKVPWHYDMICSTYKRKNPNPPAEDVKLKTLAEKNLWRQCIKCNQMIELLEGCYHMTCRCGYEFCYTCGSEWKNKKATCTCPLWNEANILYDDDDDDDFDDDSDEDDDEEEYYDSESDDYY